MCKNNDCKCNGGNCASKKVDANGRFTDPTAYEAGTIGGFICSILGEQNLPVGLVEDIIKLQLDMEPSKGCSTDELRKSLVDFGNELASTFADGKATADEVRAGFEYALDLVGAFHELHGKLEGDADGDSKTVH